MCRRKPAEGPLMIRFKARLSRPASPKGATWTFLVLPMDASARLPTRAMTSVEGSFGGSRDGRQCVAFVSVCAAHFHLPSTLSQVDESTTSSSTTSPSFSYCCQARYVAMATSSLGDSTSMSEKR